MILLAVIAIIFCIIEWLHRHPLESAHYQARQQDGLLPREFPGTQMDPIYSKPKVIPSKVILSPKSSVADFTNSSAYLRGLLNYLEVDRNLKRVVVLGPNEGGWLKVLVEEFSSESIDSYLWWKKQELPGVCFYHDEIDVKTDEISSVEPYRCDTLLCDMQPGSVELELANLKVLEKWLKAKPRVFIIRVVYFNDKAIISMLESLRIQQCKGCLIGVRYSDLNAVYFVGGLSIGSISESAEYLASNFSNNSGSRQPVTIWPIPSDLPVPHLGPLDMSATLKPYGQLTVRFEGVGMRRVERCRKFMKRIGYFPLEQKLKQESTHRIRMIDQLIEPIKPLVENDKNWILTSSNSDALAKTISSKIDQAPVEHHSFHGLLWTSFRTLVNHLRKRGGRVVRLSDEEVEHEMKKTSSMGPQDKEFNCKTMGEFLKKEDWRTHVAVLRQSLLNGKPIKADYCSFGKREVKSEEKTRMIWSPSAIMRLYETQIFGSADKLLYLLPYSVKRNKSHDYGEYFFSEMEKGNKAAVCDDISGWDTKVSHAILCMECAFLQMLSDDEDHKKEIEQLYRVYAYPLVSVIERDPYYPSRFVKVFYQLQGQRASGQRITYCMNTITNIVFTMTRAAYSQGIRKENQMKQWMEHCLKMWKTTERYGGKVSGDDIVIIVGNNNQEAKKFAGAEGVKVMNETGLIRKGKGEGHSDVVTNWRKIDFCSRKFVKVPMYSDGKKAFDRIMPIRRVDEIIMRKILRENRFERDYELAWLREQGISLLIEFFHIQTIRKLAFAILSATPNNISLNDDHELGPNGIDSKEKINKERIIGIINKLYFGKGTNFPNKFRAKTFDDLGYISEDDRLTYDLNFKDNLYLEWELDSNLYKMIKDLREVGKDYDDWIPPPPSRISKIKNQIEELCSSLFRKLTSFFSS